MKVVGAVKGSPSLIVRTVSVDVKLNTIRSCVKVEVAVLGSPSLIVRTVSVDVKRHCPKDTLLSFAPPLYKLAMPADRRGLDPALRGEVGGGDRGDVGDGV